jgi:hypothetical protein
MGLLFGKRRGWSFACLVWLYGLGTDLVENTVYNRF